MHNKNDNECTSSSTVSTDASDLIRTQSREEKFREGKGSMVAALELIPLRAAEATVLSQIQA